MKRYVFSAADLYAIADNNTGGTAITSPVKEYQDKAGNWIREWCVIVPKEDMEKRFYKYLKI